jgi:hypothetical protein
VSRKYKQALRIFVDSLHAETVCGDNLNIKMSPKEKGFENANRIELAQNSILLAWFVFT